MAGAAGDYRDSEVELGGAFAGEYGYFCLGAGRGGDGAVGSVVILVAIGPGIIKKHSVQKTGAIAQGELVCWYCQQMTAQP